MRAGNAAELACFVHAGAIRSRIVRRRPISPGHSARQPARADTGHIASVASSLALALRSERSTLAVAGVFGAGKTRSLTFLLAWLALTTHIKIAVAHKENPAGRAITKLLTTFDLQPCHQQYFIRPVGREEAAANTANAAFDLQASQAASRIPGSQPRSHCHHRPRMGPEGAKPLRARGAHGEC